MQQKYIEVFVIEKETKLPILLLTLTWDVLAKKEGFNPFLWRAPTSKVADNPGDNDKDV